MEPDGDRAEQDGPPRATTDARRGTPAAPTALQPRGQEARSHPTNLGALVPAQLPWVWGTSLDRELPLDLSCSQRPGSRGRQDLKVSAQSALQGIYVGVNFC